MCFYLGPMGHQVYHSDNVPPPPPQFAFYIKAWSSGPQTFLHYESV